MNFLTGLEGRGQDQGVSTSCQGLTDLPPCAWPPWCLCAQTASAQGTPVRVDQGPWQGPCFIFITSSKAVSPNSSRVAVLRVRASPKELEAQLSPNLCILCWCRCIGSRGLPHGLAPPDLLLLSFTSSIACSNVLCSMSSLWEVLKPPISLWVSQLFEVIFPASAFLISKLCSQVQKAFNCCIFLVAYYFNHPIVSPFSSLNISWPYLYLV